MADLGSTGQDRSGTYLRIHLDAMLSVDSGRLHGVVLGAELVAFRLRLGFGFVMGDGEAEHAVGGGGHGA